MSRLEEIVPLSEIEFAVVFVILMVSGVFGVLLAGILVDVGAGMGTIF